MVCSWLFERLAKAPCYKPKNNNPGFQNYNMSKPTTKDEQTYNTMFVNAQMEKQSFSLICYIHRKDMYTTSNYQSISKIRTSLNR